MGCEGANLSHWKILPNPSINWFGNVWDMKVPDTVHPDAISDCQQDAQGCIFDEVRGVADRQVCSACSGCAVCLDLQTCRNHLKYHQSCGSPKPCNQHAESWHTCSSHNYGVPGKRQNVWRADWRGGGKKLQLCLNSNSHNPCSKDELRRCHSAVLAIRWGTASQTASQFRQFLAYFLRAAGRSVVGEPLWSMVILTLYVIVFTSTWASLKFTSKAAACLPV